jgi:hypothetical protein
MGTYIVRAHQFAFKTDPDGQTPHSHYGQGDEVEVPDDAPGLEGLLQKGVLESKSHAEKRADVEKDAGKPDNSGGGSATSSTSSESSSKPSSGSNK